MAGIATKPRASSYYEAVTIIQLVQGATIWQRRLSALSPQRTLR